MAFNNEQFSSRKLQARRFTSDNAANSSVEAFTSTIDMQSYEVLTDDRFIPTSSLPFSGSSQDGFYYTTGSVIESAAGDYDVLRYWYQHKLTRGAATDDIDELYFFLSGEPASATDTVASNQKIEATQQTNFISNKNLTGSLSAGDAEETTLVLGYNVVVYASTGAPTISDKIAPADYTFDYKTGVLSFVNTGLVSSNEFVYITAYQYVGRTLKSQLEDGSLGGGSGGVSSFNDLTDVPPGLLSGSDQISGEISGSTRFEISGSDDGFVVGQDSSIKFVSGTAGITVVSNGSDTITIGDSGDDATLNTLTLGGVEPHTQAGYRAPFLTVDTAGKIKYLAQTNTAEGGGIQAQYNGTNTAALQVSSSGISTLAVRNSNVYSYYSTALTDVKAGFVVSGSGIGTFFVGHNVGSEYSLDVKTSYVGGLATNPRLGNSVTVSGSFFIRSGSTTRSGVSGSNWNQYAHVLTYDTGSGRVHFNNLNDFSVSYNNLSDTPNGLISGSSFSSTAQGTLSASINDVVTIVDLGLETTDNATFAGLDVGSTNAGTIDIGTNASSVVTIGNSANTVTFAGSASIAGDLIVQGSTTSINTTNLNVEDQFILLASGSVGTKDGGIIVQSGSTGVGTALYFDADANRWAVNPHNTVNWDDNALTPKQYVVSVSASIADPTSTPQDFGSTNEYYGMMHVNTNNGEIWIYS